MKEFFFNHFKIYLLPEPVNLSKKSNQILAIKSPQKYSIFAFWEKNQYLVKFAQKGGCNPPLSVWPPPHHNCVV